MAAHSAGARLAGLVVALLLCSARAHVCFEFPAQRGALNVSDPGDASCYRRTDYCGGVPLAAPLATFAAGETAVLTLRQNLNHFLPARPGFIDVAVSASLTPGAGDWTELARLADAPAFDMVAQTVLTVAVTMPAAASAHSLLRVRYVSYNPLEVDPPANTDAIFYNCADIRIVAAETEAEEEEEGNRRGERAAAAAEQPSVLLRAVAAAAAAVAGAGAGAGNDAQALLSAVAKAAAGAAGASSRGAPLAAGDADYSCSTPPAWSANFTEANAWGFVRHSVWWDAATNMTRWDQEGAVSGPDASSLSLINNYTTPVEYVNFVSPQGACYAFGNDAFYPWAFGAALNMTYFGRTGDGVDTWRIAGAPHASWMTQDLGGGLCRPLAWTRGEASAVLTGFAAGAIDGAVFVPAPACKAAVAAEKAEEARAAGEGPAAPAHARGCGRRGGRL